MFYGFIAFLEVGSNCGIDVTLSTGNVIHNICNWHIYVEEEEAGFEF